MIYHGTSLWLGIFTVLLPPLTSIEGSCPELTQIQGAAEFRQAFRRALQDTLPAKVIVPRITVLGLKRHVMTCYGSIVWSGMLTVCHLVCRTVIYVTC